MFWPFLVGHPHEVYINICIKYGLYTDKQVKIVLKIICCLDVVPQMHKFDVYIPNVGTPRLPTVGMYTCTYNCNVHIKFMHLQHIIKTTNDF
jgi:hypothetical protein